MSIVRLGRVAQEVILSLALVVFGTTCGGAVRVALGATSPEVACRTR